MLAALADISHSGGSMTLLRGLCFPAGFPISLEGVPGVRAFVGPDATRARLLQKKNSYLEALRLFL